MALDRLIQSTLAFSLNQHSNEGSAVQFPTCFSLQPLRPNSLPKWFNKLQTHNAGGRRDILTSTTLYTNLGFLNFAHRVDTSKGCRPHKEIYSESFFLLKGYQNQLHWENALYIQLSKKNFIHLRRSIWFQQVSFVSFKWCTLWKLIKEREIQFIRF